MLHHSKGAHPVEAEARLEWRGSRFETHVYPQKAQHHNESGQLIIRKCLVKMFIKTYFIIKASKQVVEIQCIDTYVPADAYSVATVVDGIMSGR